MSLGPAVARAMPLPRGCTHGIARGAHDGAAAEQARLSIRRMAIAVVVLLQADAVDLLLQETQTLSRRRKPNHCKPVRDRA